MFDIKKIIGEAQAEVSAESASKAKVKIKIALQKIADGERIVQNLRDEYAVLLRDLGA
jgi:hypothetical protein